MATVKLTTIFCLVFALIHLGACSTCCFKQAYTSDSEGRPTVICVLPMPCQQPENMFDHESDGSLNRGERRTISPGMNCPEGYMVDGNICREKFSVLDMDGSLNRDERRIIGTGLNCRDGYMVDGQIR